MHLAPATRGAALRLLDIAPTTVKGMPDPVETFAPQQNR
jgi:hypothetical protein